MPVKPSLERMIRSLLAPGKGILAADESLPTITKRFKSLGIALTEENRRAYREMLFSTRKLGESISGVILFEETIRQRTSAGLSMPELLHAQGIVPGIKVDGGTAALPGSPEEKFTLGLDGLRERLAGFRELGACFTKWRAVISIGDGLPSPGCLDANAEILALFAALSQEAGLVPIVEPEVLMEGDHSLERCEEVMERVLDVVFAALRRQRVVAETMLLKTGMVLPGEDCAQQSGPEEIAAATLRCLRRAVPAAVPGVVFLSGGQTELAATERLNAICRGGATPWKLTFSYGRALQDQAMKTWNGSPDQVKPAQAALSRRARCNGLAVQGKYTSAAERARS